MTLRFPAPFRQWGGGGGSKPMLRVWEMDGGRVEGRQIQGQTVTGIKLHFARRSEVGWKTDTGTDRDRHMHVLTVAYLYRDGREEETDTDKQTYTDSDRDDARTYLQYLYRDGKEGESDSGRDTPPRTTYCTCTDYERRIDRQTDGL